MNLPEKIRIKASNNIYFNQTEKREVDSKAIHFLNGRSNERLRTYLMIREILLAALYLALCDDGIRFIRIV